MAVETYRLYDGEVVLHYNPKSHAYSVNGKIAPGVTSIIQTIAKPALMYWAVSCALQHIASVWKPGSDFTADEIKAHLMTAKAAHQRISREAAGLGTRVHEWIRAYIIESINLRKPTFNDYLPKLLPLPEDTQVRKGCEAFLDWRKEHKVFFTETERKIYSRKYSYAGTLDAVATVNGTPAIIDFKTSSGIYNEMRFQLAAYRCAWNEEHDDGQATECWLVRLDKKTGEVEAAKFDDYLVDLSAFLGALAVYRRQQQLETEKRGK